MMSVEPLASFLPADPPPLLPMAPKTRRYKYFARFDVMRRGWFGWGCEYKGWGILEFDHKPSYRELRLKAIEYTEEQGCWRSEDALLFHSLNPL